MMITALLILTIGWFLVLLIQALPLLRYPLARQKRNLIITMIGLVSVGFVFVWLGRESLHLITWLLLLLSCLATSGMFILLKRIDYYVDDILREVFLVVVTCVIVVATTAFWYWGIAQPTSSLIFLRLTVASIPVLGLLLLWLTVKEDHTWWMLGVYIVLIVIKTLLFPLWGVWTIVLLALYAILVGYILHWMAETTYAEQLFSWNIKPSRVWIVVVLSAGLLVLAF